MSRRSSWMPSERYEEIDFSTQLEEVLRVSAVRLPLFTWITATVCPAAAARTRTISLSTNLPNLPPHLSASHHDQVFGIFTFSRSLLNTGAVRVRPSGRSTWIGMSCTKVSGFTGLRLVRSSGSFKSSGTRVRTHRCLSTLTTKRIVCCSRWVNMETLDGRLRVFRLLSTDG